MDRRDSIDAESDEDDVRATLDAAVLAAALARQAQGGRDAVEVSRIERAGRTSHGHEAWVVTSAAGGRYRWCSIWLGHPAPDDADADWWRDCVVGEAAVRAASRCAVLRAELEVGWNRLAQPLLVPRAGSMLKLNSCELRAWGANEEEATVDEWRADPGAWPLGDRPSPPQ
jgi:hypothetical protein